MFAHKSHENKFSVKLNERTLFCRVSQTRTRTNMFLPVKTLPKNGHHH